MRSKKLATFDRVSRELVLPALINAGFTAQADRVFWRNIEHEGTRSIQLVEFQIGRHNHAGTFTVNLAVFNAEYLGSHTPESLDRPRSCDAHCEQTQRLGFFKPPHRTWIDRLRGHYPQPRDYWWHQVEKPDKMRAVLAGVVYLVLNDGLHWLDKHTTRKAFEWALKRLDSRKRWLTETNPNRTPVYLEEEPFPE